MRSTGPSALAYDMNLPADEPASLLLERITAKRLDVPASKRRGYPRISAQL